MELESLIGVERRGTDCLKWDGMQHSFGEEGLDAFWVADMDFHAPLCVRETLRHWADTAVFGYYAHPQEWKLAFLDWMERRHGLRMEAEWLRFSPGIVTGLYWMVSALSEPGDAVAVLKPVYYPFFHAVRDTGRWLVSCDLRNENGVYTIDFDALEALFDRERPKLLILSSPHNPVGRVFLREELERISALCDRYGVTVLSDEIHQDLVFPGHRQVPMLSVRQANTVAFASASKTFNLAGLQNSYLILPDPALRAKFDAYAKSVLGIHGGAEVGELAAAAAYRGGEPWLGSLLLQVRENFEAIRAVLREKAPKAVVTELEGTYLMWIDLRAYVRTKEAVKELVQTRCRLAVDYGDWFGGEDYVGFIRLNLATSRENCLRAANRLGDALASVNLAR